MTALRLDSLVVGRGGFRVGPFDLTIPPGTLVALVGPNGGGKTTLLRTIAGLIPPRAGEVKLPSAETPALLPAPGTIEAAFAADHVVALGRAGHAGRSLWSPALVEADRAAARDALAALGIAALADRPFDRLSSGQQQVVLLARLLVQDAPVCLLDEPTALLDPAQLIKVELAMRRLAAGERIVMTATHSLAAASSADLVITVGDLIASGPPGDVLSSDTVSRLYGADIVPCAACGQPVAPTMRA